MTENAPDMDKTSAILPETDDPASRPDDDIPDMTTPYWTERFDKAIVQRGRPKGAVTKVSTTLRLDPEVLAAFKADGPGWQSRINAALRRAVGL